MLNAEDAPKIRKIVSWYYRFNTGLKLSELLRKFPKAPLFVHHANIAKHCQKHPDKQPHNVARASTAPDFETAQCNSTTLNNQVLIHQLLDLQHN